MDITKSALAAVAAMTLSVGAAQAATTFDFTGGSPDTGNFDVSCGVGGILNGNGCDVTTNPAGYGVNGKPDTNEGNIDGFPLWSSESLTVTFDWAVKLVNFTLGNFNPGVDDYNVYLDDIFYGKFGATPLDINQNVTSFTIEAVGEVEYVDSQVCWFGHCKDVTKPDFVDDWGNDSFTLASMTVAPVPVPAAGILLLTALGGLGVAARRRKA